MLDPLVVNVYKFLDPLLRILTGKKHHQIKFQSLQKAQI